MNYKGIIIKESLKDISTLKEVRVLETKIESVTPKHQTPWLNQWTLFKIEIPEEKGETFANKLSNSFDPNHPDWYADFKNNQSHFIVFSKKVFKVHLGNPDEYQSVKAYGKSIGIPEYQLDFV